MALTKDGLIQLSLRVSRKELITPHYIRVYLTGDHLAAVANTTIGVNNKILLPPKGCDEIHFPEYDYQEMKWKEMPAEIKPTIRTYTHRGINLQSNEIWIDFVAHGDEGPASAWAISCKTGDLLGVLMKDGKSALYPQRTHYLLIGDATAIPVLSAILEDLPPSARGTCIIEVGSSADKQLLSTQAQIEFIWLTHDSTKDTLVQAVKQQALAESDRFAFVAAEFNTVKALRHYFRKEQAWSQDELYAYSYWKRGSAEDKSTTARQKEKEAL